MARHDLYFNDPLVAASKQLHVPGYLVVDEVSRSAIATMVQGDLCYQTDSDEVYIYNNAVWNKVGSLSSQVAPWKKPVDRTQDTALPANTYDNGDSGVGATLTGVSNGALTFDSLPVSVGQRFLVKSEATSANNGVYVVSQVGDGSNPYILIRDVDFDTADEMTAGTCFYVAGGPHNLQVYVMIGNVGMVGTDFIGFSLIAGAVVAGGGYLSIPPSSVSLGDILVAQPSIGPSSNGFAPAMPGGDVTSIDSSAVFLINGTSMGSWKQPVDLATTAALAANTYSNGTLGAGATLTANSNGAIAAIDGVTPTLNMRILVKSEATASNDGVYVLTQVGDASHPYILTRATDFDTAAKMIDGASLTVRQGTTWGNSVVLHTTTGTITVGTTALTFLRATAPGTSGQIMQYGTSNNAKANTMSGDATIDASGVLTIANGAVTNVKVASTAAIAQSKLQAYGFSCVVDKGIGNDSNPTGPFLTIGAAVTYLKSLSLSSTQHGAVFINPGQYGETISIASADNSRYVDFIGADNTTTAVFSTSNPVVNINIATAENQFSNLTIQYTGSTLGQAALSVAACASNFTMENVKILSAQACISNWASNAFMTNSWIESTATNAETLITNFSGRMTNMVIRGASLNGGVGISIFSGKLEQFILELNQSVRTDGWDSSGGAFTASYGRILIGGECYSSPSSLMEYLYLDSPCIGPTPLVDHVKGTMRYCFFNMRQTSGQNSVNFMDASTGVIDSCTFIQANANAVIGNISAGNIIRNCFLSSTATSGYCVAASGTAPAVTLENITANRPIDPNFTLTNATAIQGPNMTKNLSQRRYVGINSANGAANGVGCPITTSGTVADGSTSSGMATTYTTTSTTGNSAWVHDGHSTTRRDQNPSLYFKFSLSSTASVRFWAGIMAATPTTSDTMAGQGAAVRFSTNASDTNWQYVTFDGTTQHVTNSGIAADTNVHTLRITLDNVNARAIFQLDGNTIDVETSNLPAATTSLGFHIYVETRTFATKATSLYASQIEMSA